MKNAGVGDTGIFPHRREPEIYTESDAQQTLCNCATVPNFIIRSELLHIFKYLFEYIDFLCSKKVIFRDF